MHSDFVIGIAIGQYKNGMTAKAIAEEFSQDANQPNVSEASIRRWIFAYQKEGEFKDNKPTGRPPKFSVKESKETSE